jgi:hypothetical protein
MKTKKPAKTPRRYGSQESRRLARAEKDLLRAAAILDRRADCIARLLNPTASDQSAFAALLRVAAAASMAARSLPQPELPLSS